MNTPPLIDVHAHFLPPWCEQEAAKHGHELPDGMPWWPAWSVEEHLSQLDSGGVDRALLSLSSPGVLGWDAEAEEFARRVNDFAAQTVTEHPDRFGFLASLPMHETEAALAELSRACDELGAEGVILSTNTRGRYLHEPEFDPLWAELSRRRCLVLVHPTSPPGWEDTAFGLPRPMVEFLLETSRTLAAMAWHGVLDRHADARVIVPHCGAALPVLADRVGLFQGLGAPETTPLNRLLERLWFDTAGTALPHHLPALADMVGRERIVYGSDYCFTPSFAVEAQLAALDDWRPTWRAETAMAAARLLDRWT